MKLDDVGRLHREGIWLGEVACINSVCVFVCVLVGKVCTLGPEDWTGSACLDVHTKSPFINAP